jgi:amino acid transporter
VKKTSAVLLDENHHRSTPRLQAPGLVRGIRRWDLVLLTIGGVVGAGIFGLPSKVYALTGGYSLLVFGVCVLVAGCRVLCFAEVGSRFSDTGGSYLYAHRTFGPIAGFEVGWLDWISTSAGFAAACHVLAGYLGYFWPPASGPARGGVITLVILVLAGVNLVGVRSSAAVGNVLTLGKLLPLLLFVAAGAFFIEPGRFSFGAPPGPASFAAATLLLLYAFSGFGSAVVPAGEMQDPARNVPFALLVAIGIIAVLYVLVQIVCIGTLPDLAGSERPLADASARMLGRAGGTLIGLGALVSVLGVLHVLMLATPRILFAMAERGQLPSGLAAVHPRFRTPHVAIAWSAAVVLALALSGTFVSAATLSTLARLLIMATTCAALPVLRLKEKRPAPFVAPAGWLVSVAALALVAWLLANSPRREARDVAIAAAVGMLLFLVFRNRSET